MQTRKLGWTDLNLTTIGFGTWALGGGDWKWSWGAQNWGDVAETAFGDFERAVSKLRNTILVRTQRAT